MFSKLGPIITLIALVGLGLWSLAAYSEHKEQLQVKETERYIQEFESGPVAAAWSRLREVWDEQTSHRMALLTRFQIDPNAERAALSNYRLLTFEIVENNKLAGEIDTVIGFFGGLGICIRVGNCDAQRASQYFGDIAWQFHDENLYFLKEERPNSTFGLDLRTVAPRSDDGLEFFGP